MTPHGSADSVPAANRRPTDSAESRAVRLRGIAELLADSDFDEVGHLHNDDARFLLVEVDRLNRAITRVLRLLADQEAYCGDERLDVPSWVQSVRKALNDE